MGTPIPQIIIPEPVAPGVTCPICWGIGKTFGNVDTPVVIQAVISGTNKASDWLPGDGEPVNGTFLLPQHDSFPCQFRLTDPAESVVINFGPTQTIVNAIEGGSNITFIGVTSDVCALVLVNTLTSKFVGGTITLTLPETT